MKRKVDWPVQSTSILRGRRRKVVALLVVVAIAWSFFLYGRPAHILPVGADQFAWMTSVNEVSSEGSRALNTCVLATGKLSKIAGLGTVSSICTWGVFHNRPLKVRFLNRAGVGLLFMTHQLHNWSLQLGYCSYPLGGPWYELTPSTRQGTSCLRGFSPLPTP